jgi:hypothetical protein
MKSKLLLSLLAVCSLAFLSSCSGLSTGPCTVNCGGGGNANLTISLYDTPPTGTNVLSFTLPIAGISLTPTTGSPVSVPVSISSVEVTRLQSDSAVIVDKASVVAGTYSAITVILGPTSATNNVFINTSGSTITSGTIACTNNSVCSLPVGAIFSVNIPLTFTLAANQNQWIGLDFNLNNAITSANGISVDLSQTGVLTATTTTRTGLPSGSVDTLEDFVGVVTALSSTSITVQSGTTGASLTTGITSTTEFDLAPINYSNCSGGTASACVQLGSVVSVDSLVNPDGSFTATEIDALDTAEVDEVEGVVYSVSNGTVGIVLADKVSASGNATLAASTTTFGTGVILTLNANNYSVDTKTLSSQLISPVGFGSSSDILPGQMIRAQVTGVATNNLGNVTATATNMLLRYSRLSGTVNTVSGNIFTIAGLPAYVPASSINPQVNTFSNLTAFDGITGLGDSNFQVGGPVSIRALYLNSTQYPFQAAKVRVP